MSDFRIAKLHTILIFLFINMEEMMAPSFDSVKLYKWEHRAGH